MADIALIWSDDLQVDETGDFASVDGGDELVQRIIRRFLTNSQSLITSTGTVQIIPDYLFEPTYGGNARAYVDAVIDPEVIGSIQSLFLNQVAQEPLCDPSQTVITITSPPAYPGSIVVQATVFLNTGAQIQIPALEITP
jgi:hypothetical protein